MTTVYLFASESDPVGNAVEILLNKSIGVHRIAAAELSDVEFDATNVLLVGSELPDEIGDKTVPSSGLIQYLGCRPSGQLLALAGDSEPVVAGISPVIAPRVGNRVIGFTGPLTVKPRPDWGIVGLGEVGSEVVKKVTATGNNAVVADMRTPRAGVLTQLGVRRNTLDLLISGSDVVSLHVHAGPTASPLISDREINLMDTDAVLINTSHSSVVDESAVLTALENGGIAGYATDCPGVAISEADESLVTDGKLIITTNPLTNQIGAAQQIARYVEQNISAHLSGGQVQGIFDVIDFPKAGDPSFWSSRMSPRQD